MSVKKRVVLVVTKFIKKATRVFLLSGVALPFFLFSLHNNIYFLFNESVNGRVNQRNSFCISFFLI